MPCECQQIGGVDGGECDQSFVITWPHSVDALKARLRVVAEAFDLGVLACPELPATDRAAWATFIAEFRAFAGKETPIFGSHNEWVTACSYAHTLDAWREKLATKCNVPGPAEIKGTDTSPIKWVAAAVIAVAVVGGGVYVARKVW